MISLREQILHLSRYLQQRKRMQKTTKKNTYLSSSELLKVKLEERSRIHTLLGTVESSLRSQLGGEFSNNNNMCKPLGWKSAAGTSCRYGAQEGLLNLSIN